MLTLEGTQSAAVIPLDDGGANAVKTFLTTLSTTKDVGLLTYWQGGPRFIAHLPRVYCYVVPMAIGDCHAGMGNLEEALESYQSALQYPPLNQSLEVVKVWTRMAQTILEQGDRAYRQAGDDVAGYDAAKAFYEQIVRTDRTIDAASPLYSHARFTDIKTRVNAFLSEDDPLASAENPVISTLLLEALSRLDQIARQLNFFGFASDYVPPFSFEYLQNTARYFAQQASQTEQRYIQFKSQAENEEFRRDQLDQQAEVARQTVVLEQRGVDRGHARHRRGQGQPELRRACRRKRGRLQETISTTCAGSCWSSPRLEAWANASSVDQDDQVKLTIERHYYYARRIAAPQCGAPGPRVASAPAFRTTLRRHKLQRAIDLGPGVPAA